MKYLRNNILLILTFSAAAFAPLIEGGTTHLPVFILQTLVLTMLAAWLTKGAREGKLVLKASSVDLAAAAFFLIAVVSAFLAPYKDMAFVWVRMVFFYILFFFMARAAVSGMQGLRHSVVLLMAVGAVETAWAFVQFASGQARVSGSFFNPNMLAGYLAPLLLLGLAVLIFDRDKVTPALRAGIAAVCACFVAAIVLTGSRGGALALFAGLFIILYKRWKAWAALATAALILLFLVVPNPVRDRAFGKDIYSYSRAQIWESTARMVKDHPLGVGLGNFKYYWARYNFPVKDAVIKYAKVASTAHGEYAQIGAEMGLPGLAAFIWGMVLFAGAARRAMRSAEDKGLAVGLAGGITAIFAHALVDSNFHEPGIVFLLVLLSALLMEAGGSGREPRAFVLPEGGTRRVKTFSLVLTVLLLVWTAAPSLAYFLSEKAEKEAASGKITQALEDTGTAIMLEPGNAAFHSQKAAFLFRASAGSPTESALEEITGELSEAERLNPADFSYPYLKAGLQYRYAMQSPPDKRQGYLLAARKDIRRALELSPFGYAILMDEARIRLESGDPAGAASALEELESLEPNYLEGRLLLARIYLKLGKNQLPRNEYSNIIRIQNYFERESLSPQERDFVKVGRQELDELKASLEKTS